MATTATEVYNPLSPDTPNAQKAAIVRTALWTRQGVLHDAVQGHTRPGQIITWLDTGNVPESFENATITGFIGSRGAMRPITGSLTIHSIADGQFRWEYSAEDVAQAGNFSVQFVATYDGGIASQSYAALWTVRVNVGLVPDLAALCPAEELPADVINSTVDSVDSGANANVHTSTSGSVPP